MTRQGESNEQPPATLVNRLDGEVGGVGGVAIQAGAINSIVRADDFRHRQPWLVTTPNVVSQDGTVIVSVVGGHPYDP